MALIPYPRMDDLLPETRSQFERFTVEHGRPSLLRWMLGWSPEASEAIDRLYHPIFAAGALDRRVKELLFAAASEQRMCFYCMGGHSRFLVVEYGYTREEVEAMRRGEMVDGMDQKEHALVQLVRRAASDDTEIEAEDIARVREHGWDDESIVEALATVAQAFFTNTFAQAMRLEDDVERTDGSDGYF